MDIPQLDKRTLQELPDPDLITLWARERLRLALGNGSTAAYEAVRDEYHRRLSRHDDHPSRRTRIPQTAQQ